MDGGGFAIGVARLRWSADTGAEDQIGDLVAHAGHHLLEVAEPFFLVDDARIFLGKSAETDAALEHVHRVEMVFPALVENLDQDELLQVRQFLPENPACSGQQRLA